MALKVRTMKLDDATWERWQARAAVASTSVAALIIQSMEASRIDPQSLAVALTDADGAIDGLRTQIVSKNAEIARLKEMVELLTFADGAKGKQVLEFSDALTAANEKITELNAMLAKAKQKPVNPAIATLRADPAMKAIDLTVHHSSGPVLKSAVPKKVRGEAQPFFKPGQRAALDVVGQAPTKGKGKR